MNRQTIPVDIIETTIYNDKPELKKLDCTSCGGTLDIVDSKHARCPHCGRHYKIKQAGNIKIDLWIDSENLEQMQPMLSKAIAIIGLIIVAIVIIVVGIIIYYASQLGM